MGIRHDVLAGGLAVVIGSGAYGAYTELSSSHNSDPSVSAEAAASTLSHFELQAAGKYCTEQTLTDAQLQAIVNPSNNNLVSQIVPTSSNGEVSFGNDSSSFVAPSAAKNVANNLPALATIEAIQSAKSGDTPVDTATKASVEYRKLLASPSLARQVCSQVVGEILDSGTVHIVTTTTDTFDRYQDAFGANGAIGNVQALTVTPLSSEKVFSPAPIVGQRNINRAQAIYDGWGITAKGQVDQVAETQESSDNNESSSANSTAASGSTGSASASGGGESKGAGAGGSGASNAKGNENATCSYVGEVVNGVVCSPGAVTSVSSSTGSSETSTSTTGTVTSTTETTVPPTTTTTTTSTTSPSTTTTTTTTSPTYPGCPPQYPWC